MWHQIDGHEDVVVARQRAHPAVLAVEASLRRVREERHPDDLGPLLRDARLACAWLSVTAPGVPALARSLRLVSQAATAIFALATAPPGAQVDIAVGPGPRVTMPATGSTRRAGPATWRAAFYAACIRRDLPALDALSRVPLDLLRRSDAGAGAQVLFCDALRGLWRGDADAASRLLRALEATKPSHLPAECREEVRAILLPEMELAYRYMSRDEDAFTKSLITGLERHRAYWSDPVRAGDPDGYLAWGPLALSALAWDAEMSLPVASGYLPRDLLEEGCGPL